MGRLCEMRDGSGTTTYAYDPRGNLTTQTVTVGGVAQTLVYAYDGADQLIRITYPSGRTVDHARDVLGRITLVATNLDGVPQALAGDIEYQPFGPMASLVFGNGIPLARTFDLDHRLTAQTAGAVQGLAFRLDPNGNLTGITNPLDPSRNQGFGYDALDRLTEAHGSYGEIGYTYDAAGNRVSRIRNGIPEPYTYAPEAHHLLQAGMRDYRYDANGNTTDNTDYGFIYGDHDRLTAVTQAGAPLAAYAYNGRGERVRKVVGGGDTGLDGFISFNRNAAQGFGHVGLGINNASTVGRRPQEQTLGVLFGDVPGEVSADSLGDDYTIVPTSSEQDRKLYQCIKRETEAAEKYNLLNNSCKQAYMDSTRFAR